MKIEAGLERLGGLVSQINSRYIAGDPGARSRVTTVGEWRSLVAHIVRDDGVGGSNPLSPTKITGSDRDRRTIIFGYIGCHASPVRDLRASSSQPVTLDAALPPHR